MNDHPIVVNSVQDEEVFSQAGQYVAFRIEEQRFAFELRFVQRVLRMAALVLVPEALEWVSGVLNLHGSVLPVLNIRKRLGLPPKAAGIRDRILVVHSNADRLGLVVDDVEEVLDISEDALQKPVGGLRGSPLLDALIRCQDRLYLVLKPGRIDSKEELDLQQLVTELPERKNEKAGHTEE